MLTAPSLPMTVAKACRPAAAFKSATVAPPETVASRASTFTEHCCIGVKSRTRPPSRKARPTQSWPPLRTDTGSPAACAASKAVRTSLVLEHAVTRAGLRSTAPFQRRVACAYSLEPGSWTAHPDFESWSFSATICAVDKHVEARFRSLEDSAMTSAPAFKNSGIKEAYPLGTYLKDMTLAAFTPCLRAEICFYR